ncbi:MAG TPA: hypothetical protein VN605_13155, partial [Thermoanaerobaculia bacterium]|nr:hypothetical protein [Thermoanaerobaculia bacterium]
PIETPSGVGRKQEFYVLEKREKLSRGPVTRYGSDGKALTKVSCDGRLNPNPQHKSRRPKAAGPW